MKKKYMSFLHLAVLLVCITTALIIVCSTMDTVTDYYIKTIPVSGDVIYAEEHIAMYLPDGRCEQVPLSQIEKRYAQGWYDTPVTRLYTQDGRQEIVYESQVRLRLQEGWYRTPVALMSKDGMSKIIEYSEYEKYRNDGWVAKEYNNNLAKLGSEIKEYIENKQGKYGIYIKNLENGDCLLLNDGQYQSASIVKLFTMGALYSETDKGNLEMNSRIQSNLDAMITISDNQCANNLVTVIGHGNCRKGFDVLNEFIRSEGCINTQHMSQFSINGKYIAFGRNFVSPYDCGILLEKIYNKTLVSKDCSEKMLNLLKNQKLTGKIPNPLPKGTVTANKTGETSNIQSDVAIVFSPKCDYIICILTNGAPSGIDDIRHISGLTYDYFNS